MLSRVSLTCKISKSGDRIQVYESSRDAVLRKVKAERLFSRMLSLQTWSCANGLNWWSLRMWFWIRSLLLNLTSFAYLDVNGNFGSMLAVTMLWRFSVSLVLRRFIDMFWERKLFWILCLSLVKLLALCIGWTSLKRIIASVAPFSFFNGMLAKNDEILSSLAEIGVVDVGYKCFFAFFIFGPSNSIDLLWNWVEHLQECEATSNKHVLCDFQNQIFWIYHKFNKIWFKIAAETKMVLRVNNAKYTHLTKRN